MRKGKTRKTFFRLQKEEVKEKPLATFMEKIEKTKEEPIHLKMSSQEGLTRENTGQDEGHGLDDFLMMQEMFGAQKDDEDRDEMQSLDLQYSENTDDYPSFEEGQLQDLLDEENGEGDNSAVNSETEEDSDIQNSCFCQADYFHDQFEQITLADWKVMVESKSKLLDLKLDHMKAKFLQILLSRTKMTHFPNLQKFVGLSKEQRMLENDEFS